MANVRLPTQFVMAAVDGIGWKSRTADLRRIYELRAANRIDGLYSLNSLGDFRSDLEDAARRLGLLWISDTKTARRVPADLIPRAAVVSGATGF